MKQKPKEFLFLALVLLVIGISLPVQVMILFEHTPLEVGAGIAKLAPLNWVVMILALLNSALVYRASPVVILTAPLFIFAVGWNNWLVAETGVNFSTPTAVAGLIGTIALHGLLLTKRARKALGNPSLRWWRSVPRRQIAVRVLVCPVLGGQLQSATFDLSMGGAFIEVSHANWASSGNGSAAHGLQVGARCTIRLTLSQLSVLNCSAEVVRQTPGRGEYPGGIAVRFINLDNEQKSALAAYLKTVHEESSETAPIAA
jgi:hypothetical protein